MLPEDLSEGALERALSGRRFGAPRRVFDSIGSTNSEALRWVEEGAAEGALVLADHQTEGRGRWGRSWLDEPGASLMFSIVLRPRLDGARAGILTTALGVAVAEGIEAVTGLSTMLKWPNDVMVDGRKIAGILVETRMSQATVEAAVAGVGINVGRGTEDLPDSLVGRATTVAAEVVRLGGAKVPDRAELLGSVVAAIERIYPLINRDAGRRLILEATKRSEVLGATVTIRLSNGGEVQGVARELRPTGGLLIDATSGPLEVTAGEVLSLRTPAP